MRRLFFWWRYLSKQARWDTGITPPELVRLVEDEGLPPGRALDLGCGTGTNTLYLADKGWQAVGVDFVADAVRTARRRARQHGVAGRTRFLVGDVCRLDRLPLDAPVDLCVDIGCAHSLSAAQRAQYAEQVARVLRPGGLLLLYMFRPTEQRRVGLEPEAVEALFSEHFRLQLVEIGEDRAAQAGSAWYRFERRAAS